MFLSDQHKLQVDILKLYKNHAVKVFSTDLKFPVSKKFVSF